MELHSELKSRGKDKYGRLIPKRIVLTSGEVIIGHYMASYGKDGHAVIDLKAIENINEWKLNQIELGTKIITIKTIEIESIEDFKLD